MTLRTLVAAALLFSSTLSASEEIQKFIEWRNPDKSIGETGLFSNVMRAVEWIYCMKDEKDTLLYVNMQDVYGYTGNVFPVLFKPIQESRVTTTLPSRPVDEIFTKFPREYWYCNIFAADGMKYYDESKWVYNEPAIYKDPDFSLFRERLYPIIMKYVQPTEELQNRIDSAIAQLNNKPYLKIGIHVRFMRHYQGYNKTADEFLDDIERDVDQIMKSKDPETTLIFLATLVEPLIDRLSAKYNVVVSNTLRSSDVAVDWTNIANSNNLSAAYDAILDTWCLANCDEIWCGSSNMTIFAACLNPHLRIYALPTLENFRGG